MPLATNAQYVGVTEAARLLQLSPQRVRQLADAGNLECVRTAIGRLIDRASIERLSAERAQA